MSHSCRLRDFVFVRLPSRFALFVVILSVIVLAFAAGNIDAQDNPNANQPSFGNLRIALDDSPEPPGIASVTGFTLLAQATGPQVAVMESAGMVAVGIDKDERVECAIPVANVTGPIHVLADVSVLGSGQANVELSLGGAKAVGTIRKGQRLVLQTKSAALQAETELRMITRGGTEELCVRWSNLRYSVGDEVLPLPWTFPPVAEVIPPPVMPNPRRSLEQMMIEWDWRMQDGIGTPRESRTWQQAIEQLIEHGDRLIERLTASGAQLNPLLDQWLAKRAQWQEMVKTTPASDAQWEQLWREIHTFRRQIAFANPLAQVGPLAFVKRVPSAFSHQLTQYAGWRARPGGGVFVLEHPGQSMETRRLESLPTGSYMHLDVSWDGQRLLFSHCETIPDATSWMDNRQQFYKLYEVNADGSELRQLTTGSFDDFSPRYLPNGKILFISTRRGGFHRCGRGPCPVYTMSILDDRLVEPRVISFHETHEWDPAVLNDGRVIYTRWDYVDRHAVHYQQLWSVRPDGSDVRAFYGNNTLNPVGVWEARPIPGSHRVMATAAAHHAMTAGSIILLDVTRGIDGLEPIERLTPDVLFPESEFAIQRWHATAGVPVAPEIPLDERRWPGHCYRSPYPLSEDFFLAAYSFESLIGEPSPNPANMFGLYLVDRFGNKELLYRDPSVGSLWPMPLRPRRVPPALPSTLVENQPAEGEFLLQDVHASWPNLAKTDAVVKRLRILQVLPKTTPHINTPRVGSANASPGKQVLGTVPVESDGSAYFRAPAGIPLAFQALDERGMAIQTMRSLTNLQPGERVGCIGCHEHRNTAPEVGQLTLAALREPSAIEPGPDGSKPFNYTILVQPVLDRHCIECHREGRAEGGIELTGEADGQFTRSYNALVPLVPFSQWKGSPQSNHEPMTHPNQFGARPSRLMQLLLKRHQGVDLNEQEYDRVITWMDTNALFYGTFDPEDQRRQQRGERIAGPALE